MQTSTPITPVEYEYARPNAVLAAVSVCVVLVVGMVAAINLAIPALAASALHPSPAELLWIVDGYVIVFACLLIPAGALGDRYGRKPVLLLGLAVFVAGSLLSAVAGSVGLVVAGRALTGFGAALVLPGTLSLIVTVFPAPRRPQAIATWAAMSGVGGALGNAGGGALVQAFGWRGLFFGVVPVAVLAFVLVAVLAPQTPTHRNPQDPVGVALLVSGSVALLYGIIEGPEHGWASAAVLVPFAIAAGLLIGFVLHQLPREHPLLDPRVFGIRRLRAASLGIGAAFFAMFAFFFVNAQYLQYAKGFSPLAAGLGILPMTSVLLVVPRRSVGLASRFGGRAVAVTGLLAVAAGLALMSLADASTPYWLYALFGMVAATGVGLATPVLSGDIVSALPPHQAGVASGLNSTTREFGSALGVAVFGTVLTSQFTAALPAGLTGGPVRSVGAALAAGPPELSAAVITAFTDAMSVGLLVVTAVLVVATVLVACWHGKPGAQTRPSS